MLRKLRFQIIAINMVLIFIIICISMGVIVNIMSKNLESSSITRMYQAIKPFTEYAESFISDKENYSMQPKDIAVAKIIPEQNEAIVIFSDEFIIQDEELQNTLIECYLSGEERGISSSDKVRFLIERSSGSTFMVLLDRQAEKQTLSSLIYTCIIICILSIVVLFIISFFLSNLALKPVEKSWAQQKQLVADVNHELKTPLTVIMANTEILEANKSETIESQMIWIKNTKSELKRLTELVNNMLFLARSDNSENIESELTKTNFSDCVENEALLFEPVYYEKDKTLQCDIEKNVFVSGSSAKLKQLCVILLDNALKYSYAQSTVTLKLSSTKEKAELKVSNKATPLSEEQQKNIFQRFYRVDRSRSREMGGNGLGLSIAESIVKEHKGKISVSCVEDTVTFTVLLNKLN